MKQYPALTHDTGIHIVEYTLQCAEFTGHVQRRFRGNVRGVLPFVALADCIEERVLSQNNNVEIIPVTDQDEFFFDVTFQSNKGSLNMQLEYKELNQLVTKIEILDFIEDETR